MKKYFLITTIILLISCTNVDAETEVSSTQTTILPANTFTATLEPAPSITFTITPTITPTATPTSIPTPKPVDLYNRLNWREFYNAIPEEWAWEWLESVCNNQLITGLVSENPDLCVTNVKPKSDLETGKYLITIDVLDYHIDPYTFIEFIPYLYKGPLNEDETLASFSHNQHFYFQNIYEEVAEYCKETYGGEYSIYGVFYRELTEEEWDYLVTLIPSWDVDKKGPAGTEESFPFP